MYTVKTKRRKAKKPQKRKQRFVSPFAHLPMVIKRYKQVEEEVEVSAEEYYSTVGMEINNPSDTLE